MCNKLVVSNYANFFLLIIDKNKIFDIQVAKLTISFKWVSVGQISNFGRMNIQIYLLP